MSSRATSDADRRIAGLAELATVTATDAATNTCTVDMGGVMLPGIPVAQIRAGVVRVQFVPTPGEQVLVVAPGGDAARAVIIGSVPTAEAVVAQDGQHPTIDLGGTTLVVRGGRIEITGPVAITGTVTVTGDVEVTGTVTATVDVIGAGKSLKTHRHAGVSAGTAQTGAPL